MGPEPGEGVRRIPRPACTRSSGADNGRRLTRSLKHRDWSRAKRQADEVAAGFAVHEPAGKAEAEPEPLTLGTLLDIYGEEVTPAKAETSQRSDRAATKMFLQFFGRRRKPATLSQRDWDRFIRARRAGKIGPSGRPVSDRTIQYDLKFLIAVFNWATKSKDEQGRPLLGSNPLRGLKTPTEKNPTRVVLSEEEYRALLRVSWEVDWRFHVALVLAHETGHRIGAIRSLKWSDIDLEGGVVRWRAEHEKTGYEHRTPMTAEALAALKEARRRNPGTGDTPVLPASTDASRCAGPVAGPLLVEPSPEARGSGTPARQRLALAQAEVRVRPHGPAPQGALRAWRLEDGQDRPSVLPEGRRGPASEGAREPPHRRTRSRLAGTNRRES